jgi:Uncharacterized conserved protein
MIQTDVTMITQLATMASKFQHQLTGHAPAAVTIVLSEDTLVVTLHEALTPAEKALARSNVGAAQVQDFHRQLFFSASQELRREITRITGREVREAAAEVEPASGAVVHAFTTGTMVQVFSLTKRGKEVGEGESEMDRWANETGQELLRQPQKDGQKS